MDIERFSSDLDHLAYKITNGMSKDKISRLDFVRYKLVDLYKKNLIKINHSVMELICANHLLKKGYNVDVEKRLTDILISDVYAEKGREVVIIEIETGFIPPEHALDPLAYYTARIVSKISRYSKFADRFYLATPVIGLLPIPNIYKYPSKKRKRTDMENLKSLCDIYYINPHIEYDEIYHGLLDSIFIIDIDKGRVIESSLKQYFRVKERLIRMAAKDVKNSK